MRGTKGCAAVRDALAPMASVRLAPLTTLGVGGPAQWFVQARRMEEVAAAHAWCAARAVPLTVIGGGSNLVVSDDGVAGLVLQMAVRGVRIEASPDSTVVAAGAGEPWDPLVAAIVARGLAGVECLSGIPGSVGGTPIQNVGAYGQEVADTIVAIQAFDRDAGAPVQLRAEDCGFAYRHSRFKGPDADRFIVCEVAWRLAGGEPAVRYPDVLAYLHQARIGRPSLAEVREAVLAIRRRKGMVIDPGDPDTRSVGSFFMNPVVENDVRVRVSSTAGAAAPAFALADGRVKIPAAWLIEKAGFDKGLALGNAGISTRHTLALINRGEATAAELLALKEKIQHDVDHRFGISLQVEPVLVGFDKR
jgi:UDP-N-acetylmuramate dehydrogenase